MYQIIGIKAALACFAGLSALVALAKVLLGPLPTSTFGWWSLLWGSVGVATLIVTLVGQTPLFVVLCRLPYVNLIFPPIDGDWIATLRSNWPAIQHRNDPSGAEIQLAPVAAKVKIVARLLHVRINLTSDSKYSTSKTIFVRLSRDAEDQSVSLHYIYQNITRVPEQTDSGAHEGAGMLTIERDGDNVFLEGTYWTNRNWHKGLNTAGEIALRRATRPTA